MKESNKKVKAPIKNNCFGPISDLEKYLNSNWWKQIFNSLYLKTDSDVVENELNTIEDVNYIIKASEIKSDQKILDICCGQGRHLLEFAKRGFKQLVGIDSSQYLIKVAKKRALFNRYFDLNFYEGDARKIKLVSDSLDLATILGNSFGYFEYQNDDLTVLKEINRILKPKGKLFLDIANGIWLEKNFQKRSWEWIDNSLLVCRERTLSEDKRLISREVIINVNKGVIKDQFYAERLYSFDSIKELLIQANFENITLLDNIKSSSTRNQDLGMMENRLFILAQVPENKTQANISFNKTINCHVLLGDPLLPDQIKNNGKFNPEDIEVIEKLKEALSELKEYNFTFIDNHKKIFSYLDSIEKPDIIFNLCDEGYNNDAKKELHIPAFLEMLNIPYTGSSPPCLAMCYNKSLISSYAKFLNIKTPSEILIDPNIDLNNNMAVNFPVILKPTLGDGSIGITQKAVCNNKEELFSYYEWLKQALPNTLIIAQEFLPGREFSVAILGNSSSYEILPILEVDYTSLPQDLPKLLSYESKWVPDSPYWKIGFKKAILNQKEQKELINASKMLFDFLDCKDYARFDFRVDKEGNIKFLEVNPNPGWCWDGKLNLMAGLANLSYSQLLDKILKSAIQRYNIKK